MLTTACIASEAFLNTELMHVYGSTRGLHLLPVRRRKSRKMLRREGVAAVLHTPSEVAFSPTRREI